MYGFIIIALDYQNTNQELCWLYREYTNMFKIQELKKQDRYQFLLIHILNTSLDIYKMISLCFRLGFLIIINLCWSKWPVSLGSLLFFIFCFLFFIIIFLFFYFFAMVRPDPHPHLSLGRTATSTAYPWLPSGPQALEPHKGALTREKKEPVPLGRDYILVRFFSPLGQPPLNPPFPWLESEQGKAGWI